MPTEDKPECDLNNHEDQQERWLKSQKNWLRGRSVRPSYYGG